MTRARFYQRGLDWEGTYLFKSGRINSCYPILPKDHDIYSVFRCRKEAIFKRWNLRTIPWALLDKFTRKFNAILTNQEIVSQKFHYFREGVKRLVIELELAEFSIFLVHLSIKFRHRQYQLQDLHSMVKNVEKPVIVAGDFNVLRGDRELQLFLAATGLRNANSNRQPSYPSRAPRRQLDYIFHTPQIRVTGFQIPQIKLSDHAPLVCEFELATEKTLARIPPSSGRTK